MKNATMIPPMNAESDFIKAISDFNASLTDLSSGNFSATSGSRRTLIVFQIDVSVCPACGHKMHIIAFVTDPASIHRYLEGEGLPTQAPPIAPARSPPQMEYLLSHCKLFFQKNQLFYSLLFNRFFSAVFKYSDVIFSMFYSTKSDK
jgi:hypothetical protein